MKKILIILSITTALFACIPPMKPLPPIGCQPINAVLVYSGMSCNWVYMGCK